MNDSEGVQQLRDGMNINGLIRNGINPSSFVRVVAIGELGKGIHSDLYTLSKMLNPVLL